MFAAALFAQNGDTLYYHGKYSVVVDSIKIYGNKTTERDVITRELSVVRGDTLTASSARYNRERIYSLGIFNKVSVYPVTVNKINYMIISVEESWYIYPLPFAELKDKDWNKITFGVDFLIRNFRGRNELIRARAQFGYDNSYFLSYSTPYLIYDKDISFMSAFSYQTARNRSLTAELLMGQEFNYKIINGSVAFGKRFGLFNFIGVNLGFDYIEAPGYLKGVTASSGRIDHLFTLGLNYTYDTRDLKQFPKEGILTNASYDFKGIGIDHINYRIFKLDFREYRNLFDNLYGKWRLTTRMTFGEDVPYYDYSFLGFSERIRGHYNDEMEGNNYYLGSVELFYPFINDLNINLKFIPLIPKELLSYRIALYAQLFGDTGTTQINHDGIKLNSFRSGYGIGLTLLILPYNTARVEMALDEYRNIQWIFDVGVSF